jgi:NADPH:quinone reductase-like Zn-dependent oxidoreductase
LVALPDRLHLTGDLIALSWWRREGGMDRITSPLLSDLSRQRLSPVVARSYPFERVGDAHRYLAERRNIGKVVLIPH